ncbi:TIGR03899 family protein [Parashewanella curva]|uniref:TIGR03899 family protein n=1 Tax=Parashewanella curva TaxID=2338552 RepID=A0A3L8PYR0_9GAMM|nr:TIGR03899 family protein [Parashewanella curva]RLV60481.1 TIGR03899 family protein [Parashewanella curva]
MSISVSQIDDKTKDVSAKRKLLSLAPRIGLAADGKYQPSNASLTERAKYRNEQQASVFQKNLEAIYKQALALTPANVTGAELDPDWLHHFYNLAETIHNPKMQELWAKILTREITSPGHFSIATLKRLTQLTQKEAQIMEKVTSLTCTINRDPQVKLLSHYRITGGWRHWLSKSPKQTLNLAKVGIPYSYIVTLIEAGILLKQEFETGQLAAKQPVLLDFGLDTLHLTPKHRQLVLGYYRFSLIGNELAQLLPPRPQTKQANLALSEFLNTDFQITDSTRKINSK